MEHAIVIAVVGILLWIEWLLLRCAGGTHDDRPDPLGPGENAAHDSGPADGTIEDGGQTIDC